MNINFQSRGKKVAVLGSTSFSGSNLVTKLLSLDFQVLGISRSNENNPIFHPQFVLNSPSYEFHRLHLVDDLSEILQTIDRFQPEYVVNFAAQGEVASSFQFPEYYYRTNAFGIVALVSALQGRDYLRRYINISTPEVYGSVESDADEMQSINPTSPYAASKASADLYISAISRNSKFPAVTVRATNVYGPRQQLYRIVPRTIIRILSGEKLFLDGGGRSVKSYIHIDDVTQGEIDIMLGGRAGEVYHLSPDGDGIAIRDLVRLICTKMGVNFDDVVEDGPDRQGQDKSYLINSTKARQEFGWLPIVNIDDGILGVIDWVNHYWEEISNLPRSYEFKI